MQICLFLFILVLILMFLLMFMLIFNSRASGLALVPCSTRAAQQVKVKCRSTSHLILRSGTLQLGRTCPYTGRSRIEGVHGAWQFSHFGMHLVGTGQ